MFSFLYLCFQKWIIMFPYISQIHINSCYTKQNFDIPKTELRQFKHILITGKNGTGKTTILKSLGAQLNEIKKGQEVEHMIKSLKIGITRIQNNSTKNEWLDRITLLELLSIKYLSDSSAIKDYPDFIFSYFKAHRKVDFKDVQTVVKEEAITENIKDPDQADNFSTLLKQYLVNRKVYEAFDFMNNGKDSITITRSQKFFNNLIDTLREILEDKNIELEFIQEDFEFYIKLSDGRKITFNQLSEGFSAFFSIVIDLLIRIDHYRKEKGDYSIDPYGIVLIDEPETHFHLSLQYNILPLLSKLFPNIQLIVATHSPAVISSLKNAIVFDLSKMEEVADWLLGSSYSELMVSHFGLDNEFSPIADKILEDINIAVKEKNIEKLRSILFENDMYLTPSLRLEIESQIIHIEAKND